MDKLGKKTSDYVKFHHFNDGDKPVALNEHVSGALKSTWEGVSDCCGPVTAQCCPSLSFLDGCIFGCHPLLVGYMGNISKETLLVHGSGH